MPAFLRAFFSCDSPLCRPETPQRPPHHTSPLALLESLIIELQGPAVLRDRADYVVRRTRGDFGFDLHRDGHLASSSPARCCTTELAIRSTSRDRRVASILAEPWKRRSTGVFGCLTPVPVFLPASAPAPVMSVPVPAP